MLVEDTVTIGPFALELRRPADPEALLDEHAFEHEEFLPYWAELWPSGVALAEQLAYTDMSGLRVIELGCGLGLPSIVAALRGARVLATDWSPGAMELLEGNAERNRAELTCLRLAWGEDLPPIGRFELVLAADVLYERRNIEQLLELLPRLGGEVWLADPGRPSQPDFLDAARGRGWSVEELAAKPPRITVHRLCRSAAAAGERERRGSCRR